MRTRDHFPVPFTVANPDDSGELAFSFVNPALGGMGVVDYLAADASVGAAPYAFGTQVYAQVMAVVIAVVWTAVVSYVALMICKVTVGLRVKEQEEREGLDVVDHGERAYN